MIRPAGRVAASSAPARTPIPALAVALVASLLATVVAAAGCAGRAVGPPPAGASGPAAPGPVTLRAGPEVPADWAARVRAEVAAAVADVAALLPGGWSRQVDTRLVATDAELRAEAGWSGFGGGPVGTVAAVAVLPIPTTSSPSGPSATPGATGGRLLVDLDVYRRLTIDGRRIVLRHELTHLATAAQTPAGMPVWLVEGFAEEVGHEGVVVCGGDFRPLAAGPRCPAGPTAPAVAGVSAAGSAVAASPAAPAAARPALTVDRAAAELAAETQSGRVPAQLPADSAFDGSDGRLAQTYQEAWLACRLLAERLGLAGLARFYRDVGAPRTAPAATPRAAGTPATSPGTSAGGGTATRAGQGTGAGTLAESVALRADTGLSWPAFVAAWRAYLVAVLGGPAGGGAAH